MRLLVRCLEKLSFLHRSVRWKWWFAWDYTKWQSMDCCRSEHNR